MQACVSKQINRKLGNRFRRANRTQTLDVQRGLVHFWTAFISQHDACDKNEKFKQQQQFQCILAGQVQCVPIYLPR